MKIDSAIKLPEGTSIEDYLPFVRTIRMPASHTINFRARPHFGALLADRRGSKGVKLNFKDRYVSRIDKIKVAKTPKIKRVKLDINSVPISRPRKIQKQPTPPPQDQPVAQENTVKDRKIPEGMKICVRSRYVFGRVTDRLLALGYDKRSTGYYVKKIALGMWREIWTCGYIGNCNLFHIISKKTKRTNRNGFSFLKKRF